MRPANVARLIGLENWRLERLAYLRGTGRDNGIALKEALGLSTAEFERMYPRFGAWLEAKGKPRGPSGAKAGPGGKGGGQLRGFKKLKLGPIGGREGGKRGRKRAQRGVAMSQEEGV